MSDMHPSLSPAENQIAQSQGWGLFDVFSSDTSKWLIQILPTDHPKHSAAQAYQNVYERAAFRDPVAIRALQVVMESLRTPPPPTKRKKK